MDLPGDKVKTSQLGSLSPGRAFCWGPPELPTGDQAGTVMMDMPRTFYPAEGQHLSKEVCSPEGTTVSTGQKEPRDSRQVLEDVQHQQGHVLGWGGGSRGLVSRTAAPQGQGILSVLTLHVPRAQCRPGLRWALSVCLLMDYMPRRTVTEPHHAQSPGIPGRQSPTSSPLY